MLLWSPAFATGHPAIDQQHQTLFQRVHDLALAIYQRHGEREMCRVLTAASVYVEVHFRMEESLMQAAGYPHLATHRAAHARLRAQVESLVDGYKEGRLRPTELLEFLESWLAAHVRCEDREMAEFLRCRAEGEATA